MKYIKTILILFVLGIATMAFVKWDINIHFWSDEDRLLCIVMIIPLFLLTTIFNRDN